jgi:hypothetical protein
MLLDSGVAKEDNMAVNVLWTTKGGGLEGLMEYSFAKNERFDVIKSVPLPNWSIHCGYASLCAIMAYNFQAGDENLIYSDKLYRDRSSG